MRMSAALRARNARRRCPRVRRPSLRRPTACRQAKKRVYDCIAAAANGLVLDEIAAALKLPPSQVMPLLSNLEIQGVYSVRRGAKNISKPDTRL